MRGVRPNLAEPRGEVADLAIGLLAHLPTNDAVEILEPNEGPTNKYSLVSTYRSSPASRTLATLEVQLPISRMLTTFPDEPTTSEDWRYLQKLLQSDLSDYLGDGSSSVLTVRKVTWNQDQLPHSAKTAFPWPTFPLSSVMFRYASLTFASYSETSDNDQTLRYLGKFYQHAREAISSSSLIEVVMASYLILLYAYVSRAPFHQVFIHFKGICGVFTSPLFKTLSRENRRDLQRVWKLCLPALRRAFWTTYQASSTACVEELELLREIYITLQDTSYILYEDIGPSPDIDHEMRARLDVLESYLTFYWDFYLAIRGQIPDEASETPHMSTLSALETSIRDIVQLIVTFTFQYPASTTLVTQASRTVSPEINFHDYPDIVFPEGMKFEDIKAASLYCWAKVIENALRSSIPNPGSVHASLVLLRLNAVISKRLGWPWARPSLLFWAGLSLRNSICSSGTTDSGLELMSLAKVFIITELQSQMVAVISSYPSYERYYLQKFKTIFKFLETIHLVRTRHGWRSVVLIGKLD